MKRKFNSFALFVSGTFAVLIILSAQKKSVSDTVLAADLAQVVNLKTANQSLKRPTYQTVSIGYGASQSQACSMEPETRFIQDGKTFSTGTIVYWTPAFTLPITGRAFFTDAATGKIWNVNSATGVIGTFTENYCP
ncbi:MAG: hypothetical protein ABI416_00410 [Ginsengibacter sp.]